MAITDHICGDMGIVWAWQIRPWKTVEAKVDRGTLYIDGRQVYSGWHWSITRSDAIEHAVKHAKAEAARHRTNADEWDAQVAEIEKAGGA